MTVDGGSTQKADEPTSTTGTESFVHALGSLIFEATAVTVGSVLVAWAIFTVVHLI